MTTCIFMSAFVEVNTTVIVLLLVMNVMHGKHPDQIKLHIMQLCLILLSLYPMLANLNSHKKIELIPFTDPIKNV